MIKLSPGTFGQVCWDNKGCGIFALLILSDWVDSGVAPAASGKDGSISSFSLFFHLQDLLHITKHKEALLSEQARLQRDVSEWVQKSEDCQREGEMKRQQLQALQNEVEENTAKLAQQEMVLHVSDHI